tara:strand:+ start:200 stop:511 length:312 start_codon:yes stop_codon:yes gene_type:complete
MTEQNNWKQFSDDISNMSKKIKSNITDEKNVDDLKNSLKAAKESIADSFSELIQIVETTVSDEEIKKDALNIVNKLKFEMSNFIETSKEKISDLVNLDTSEEE